MQHSPNIFPQKLAPRRTPKTGPLTGVPGLKWVVLSLQAASIGQIPVILCCLGLLLTPLLVTCDGPGRLAALSNLAVLVS